GIEEHVLLLDADRVRLALAEGMVEDARLRAGSDRSLAGDRRRVDLLHDRSITASTSISTSQRGSRRPVTTPVVAGRARPNASAWARPTSPMWAASVTKIRVRTT